MPPKRPAEEVAQAVVSKRRKTENANAGTTTHVRAVSSVASAQAPPLKPCRPANAETTNLAQNELRTHILAKRWHSLFWVLWVLIPICIFLFELVLGTIPTEHAFTYHLPKAIVYTVIAISSAALERWTWTVEMLLGIIFVYGLAEAVIWPREEVNSVSAFSKYSIRGLQIVFLTKKIVDWIRALEYTIRGLQMLKAKIYKLVSFFVKKTLSTSNEAWSALKKAPNKVRCWIRWTYTKFKEWRKDHITRRRCKTQKRIMLWVLWALIPLCSFLIELVLGTIPTERAFTYHLTKTIVYTVVGVAMVWHPGLHQKACQLSPDTGNNDDNMHEEAAISSAAPDRWTWTVEILVGIISVCGLAEAVIWPRTTLNSVSAFSKYSIRGLQILFHGVIAKVVVDWIRALELETADILHQLDELIKTLSLVDARDWEEKVYKPLSFFVRKTLLAFNKSWALHVVIAIPINALYVWIRWTYTKFKYERKEMFGPQFALRTLSSCAEVLLGLFLIIRLLRVTSRCGKLLEALNLRRLSDFTLHDVIIRVEYGLQRHRGFGFGPLGYALSLQNILLCVVGPIATFAAGWAYQRFTDLEKSLPQQWQGVDRVGDVANLTRWKDDVVEFVGDTLLNMSWSTTTTTDVAGWESILPW